jgi:ABC-type transport system involved in multi-copper enzyme maturation permease subunit
MNYIITTARSVLFEAVRSRLPWMAIVIIGLALGVAAFLHQVALTEQRAIQTAVIAALLRAAAVFMVTAFVITSMVREANDKVSELLLSQPVPRSAYLAGKFLGYAAVGVALAMLFALPLVAFVPVPRILVWALSLSCELLIMAAVSLFCVLSLSHTVAAFAATVGFYVLARTIDGMRLIASSPLRAEGGWVDAAMRWVVDAIAVLLPGLERMTLTGWLLESPPGAADVAALVAQTGLYLTLIGAAALFDLYRKSL